VGAVVVSTDSNPSSPGNTQSAPNSRLSKTDPADRQNSRHGPSRGDSLKQPLTEHSEVGLRREVLDEDRDGIRPVTWRDSVWRWREWYKESAETQAVFENTEGETVKGGDPNRFHPDYGDKQ